MPGPRNKQPRRKAESVEELRSRLQLAEETIRALRAGEVDALVVPGPSGEQVFTLAGSENAYRRFVEVMNEGAVTLAPDGTILYCNRGFASLMRGSLDHILGGSFFDFIAEGDKELFRAIFQKALVSYGKAEIHLLRSDGTAIPSYLSLKSFDEHGTRTVFIVVTDLSEQKKLDAVLAAGNLARLILDQSADSIAVCESSGRIILCNPALNAFCGGPALFRHFDEVLPLMIEPGSCEPHRRPFHVREATAGKTFRTTEVAIQSGPMEGFHLLLSATPIRLNADEPYGCVINLVNIEERKRAHEALIASERLAATGRLAATIAHEINNPLEGMTNLLFLLSEMKGLDPTARQYVETAQQELRRVAHITRQTLGFYRQSARPTAINLGELLDSVFYLFAHRLEKRGIKVTKEYRFEASIFGYPSELRQVISNLVVNAVEACADGGKLRVRVYQSKEWANSNRPGVRVTIADKGNGIPPEHCKRLFEPFFTTKGEKGTGLGLWVSQGIVQKHGGFIRLRSSVRPESSGTAFCVFLPFTNEERTLSMSA